MDSDRGEKLNAENTGNKPRWGLGIADITPELRQQLQAPENIHGAVIQRVLPGSPSDDAGLQPGQVIMGDRMPWCSSGSMGEMPSAYFTLPREPNSVAGLRCTSSSITSIKVQRGPRGSSGLDEPLFHQLTVFGGLVFPTRRDSST